MPNTQLIKISVVMLRAKSEATPLKKKIARPMNNKSSCRRPSESFPATKTKGIISNEGSEVSNCTSRSVAWGKMWRKSPKIGEIASPGNEETAETDQMPSNTRSEIEPLPVLIFMAQCFSGLLQGSYQTKKDGFFVKPSRIGML